MRLSKNIGTSIFVLLLIGAAIGVWIYRPKTVTKEKPQPASNVTISNNDTRKEVAIYVSPVDTYYENCGYRYPPAKISAAAIGILGGAINSPFSKGAALRKMIPANYFKWYYIGSDSCEMVVWQCKDGKKKVVSSPTKRDSMTVFPLPDGNMTEAIDTLQYTDEAGNRNIIFSFATHILSLNAVYDEMYEGNSTGVYLGLALFTERKGKWILKNYTNGIGCYGTNQHLPHIQLARFGKNNYGCYLLDEVSGADKIVYTNLHAFGLVNGQFEPILSARVFSRNKTYTSHWDIALQPKETTKSHFSTQQLIVAGDYNNTDTYYLDDSTAINPALGHKKENANKQFDFKVVREYGFKGQKYVKVKSVVEEL